MSRRVLICLLVACLLPLASAGTQEDPEMADPAGDAQVEEGECSAAPLPACALMDDAEPADQADLLAVWLTEPDNTAVTFHIETVAAGDNDTQIDLAFNVTPTAISIHTGSPEHRVAYTITGTTPDDANLTVMRSGAILNVTIPRSVMDAVGGDSITAITVAATHQHTQTMGQGPLVATRTDTTTDHAPDEGQSVPFDLSRPPVVPDMALDVTGGEFTQTIDGAAQTGSFTGSQASLNSSQATITYHLTLTNAGSDPDAADISVFDPTGTLASNDIVASVTPTRTGTLLPGQSVQVTFTAQLDGTPPGQHVMLVSAASDRGGAAAEALSVSIVAPPAAPDPAPAPAPAPSPEPGPRESAVPGLGFLTPLAEGLGLDKAFGEWAELVLLAILLLLLILIVFLILFLAGRRELSIEIEPRSIDARPGETAEFTLKVRNRKNRHLDTVTQFEGDPTWETAVVFGDATLAKPDTDAQLGLGPKKGDDGVRVGKLRVTVPETAGEKETDRITLGVAALDAEGQPSKRREATVRVRARDAAVAEGLPMRLSSVDHEPAEPVAGETVRTTARIENDSEDETLRLRVVLNVDGEDKDTQAVVLPPHSARAVVFRWQVPTGSSKVRVRVYPGQ